MTRQTITMTSSIQARTNKGPEAPSMPTPTAVAPAPTTDNSAEVAKQRAIEEQRQKRASGLSATDNTGGEGVALNKENIDKPEAKTLLGQ